MALPSWAEILEWIGEAIKPLPVLDYRQELMKLWLSEDDIWPNLVNRFQEHLRLYKNWVDANISLLTERIEQSNTTTRGKVEVFEAWLAGQEELRPVQIADSNNILNDATQATTEWLSNAIESGEKWWQTKAKEFISEKFKSIPLIWEWLSETVFTAVKDKYETGKGGIITFLLGLFPFWKTLLNNFWIKEGINDDNGSTVEKKGSKDDSIDTKSNTENNTTEAEKNDSLSERKNKIQVIWYMLLWKVSWFPHEKGSPEIEILQKIWKKSLIDVQWLIFESNGNFKEALKIEDLHISEDSVRRVIIWIIGPINREYLDWQLKAQNIDSYIGIAPNFNERAKSLFSTNELQEIYKKKKNYREMSISIISRLSVMSIEDYAISLTSVPWELSWRIINFLGGVAVTQELQNLRWPETNDELYPKNISFVFSHIFASKATHNATTIIRNAEVDGVELSEKDKDIIREIVAYKETIISQISQYSLWLDGFENEIDKNLTWANIMLLRNLLKWRSINNAEWFDKVILFTWSHGVLTGVLKWNYETKILEHIADSSQNDSNLLTVVAYRVLEIERNIVYESAKNIKWRIDWWYELALGLDKIDNTWVKWVLVNIWEILTVSMALKLLRKTPIMRAVLLATTWVLSVSIFFWVKEGLHNKLDSDIWRVYAEFLQEIAPKIWEESIESLAKSITTWEMGIIDLYKKLEALWSETLEEWARALFD